MPQQKKGVRITGPARSQLTVDISKKYAKGRSIRDLADEQGRSYGFIHRLLIESGCDIRGRGGSQPRKSRSHDEGGAGL